MTRNPPSDPVDGAAVSLVSAILSQAVTRGASDVHFEPVDDGLLVRFRLDGVLHDTDRLAGPLRETVIARLKVLAGLLTYRLDVPQEGALRFEMTSDEPAIDLRIATFPTVRGERAVVRLLPKLGAVTGLSDLGLDPAVTTALADAVVRPQGLVLLTGPAGAGKSTTLCALARESLDRCPGRSVISLEDPVERGIDGVTQIQVQPHGALNYVTAMRSLLRQDVEVLLVGEIRDAETAHIVVEAALTGHLVLSTLHSGDPAEAIARLVEIGIAPYQLVSALHVVLAQRLVRRVCAGCRGAGCATCGQIGYAGRIACGQLATVTEPLRAAVLRALPTSDLRPLIARQGPTLADDAVRLVDAGVTTLDEVRRIIGLDDRAVHQRRAEITPSGDTAPRGA